MGICCFARVSVTVTYSSLSIYSYTYTHTCGGDGQRDTEEEIRTHWKAHTHMFFCIYKMYNIIS